MIPLHVALLLLVLTLALFLVLTRVLVKFLWALAQTSLSPSRPHLRPSAPFPSLPPSAFAVANPLWPYMMDFQSGPPPVPPLPVPIPDVGAPNTNMEAPTQHVDCDPPVERRRDVLLKSSFLARVGEVQRLR
ncbi:hypothetical protein C8Q76DRAFT_797555 [Earliella scabrosa]|nr:hypothetical protein C8Q76DRAFT_797555 [Earliella scabrosa]